MFMDRLSPRLSPQRGPLEFGRFPRRGYVFEPRVAVLGYPGKAAEFRNPNGVVAKPALVPRPGGLPS
jgi:hypothetical protein